MKAIVLASGSQSRRALLTRLGLDFEVRVSGADETPRDGETVAALVSRLALGKAHAVAAMYPNALIIGSDQAANVGGRILDKPDDDDDARRQLSLCSNTTVDFHTCVCLLDTAENRHWIEDAVTTVHFRKLGAAEIARYVDREKPFDCAGSFRSEALGITLFERIESDDPTALLGLPLITLCAMLRQAGLELP